MTVDKNAIDALTQPTTVVVVQDGGLDAAIAQRWLQKHAPGALKDERVFTELHLPHLQANMSVCAVFRSPATPALQYTTNGQGSMIGVNRPDEDTFAEVIVTKPIKVGDYWERTSPMTPGKPNTPAFMEALQATLIPLRLDYIDKGESKPSIMKLKTL